MGIKRGDEYRCAKCGQVFRATWSDEEAHAEAEAAFSADELAGGVEVVCDDCYRDLMVARDLEASYGR